MLVGDKKLKLSKKNKRMKAAVNVAYREKLMGFDKINNKLS